MVPPAEVPVDWATAETVVFEHDDIDGGTGRWSQRGGVDRCTRGDVTGRRTAAEQITLIATSAVQRRVLCRDDAALLVWVAVGHRIPAIAQVLGRDESVIRRRLYRITETVSSVAA